ncbi:MAG TPA: ATP-binding protein, partial [Bacteroidales bacterium]|nr:ATP-binding protein [Bacteroidales bacterium]
MCLPPFLGEIGKHFIVMFPYNILVCYFVITEITRESKKILGKEHEPGKPGWAVFSSLIFKEDWLEFEEKSKKAATGEIDEFSHEFRIRVDSETRWANVIGKAVRSGKDKITALKGTIQDITERKKAEEALNHSHDLMRYVIEHNRGAVAVHDRDMRYIYVSQRYLSDYKIADKNIIGKHHYEVFPDFPQKWRKAHQEALKGRILREENDIYEREDGSVDYTRWECRPWYDADQTIGGIIVYTEMITERKRIELALKNSELQLNSMFNSAPVIMILLNESKDVLKMNKFGMESTGRNMESLTGLKPGDVMRCVNSFGNVCGTSSHCLLCTLRSAIDSAFIDGKECFKVEAQMVSLNGETLKTHTILVSTSIISNVPQKRVLITIDEITERKELETELIKAKERAEESDKLKSAFLANISHEIRTPMNGIMGFSEMLTKPGLSEEKRKQFSFLVQDGCKQLLSIITDVIEIAMLDSDQMSVSRSEININDLMQELFLQFRSAAATKNLEFNFIKTKKEASVHTDREKIGHIFSNLLTNAIKFTKQGKVQFGCSMKGNNAEFYVSDTGIGIEKELFEAIFERFRQAETSDTRNYGGTGLGLSIAKGLTALLGGRIWLESVPGSGTTFFFTIPDAGTPIIEEDEKINIVPENEILIAEDDEINFLFIQEVLQEINCFPYHARNGREAIQTLREHPGIRLVLMDIKMPVMDGYEAAMEIKQLYPSLPVYAQTAYPVSTSGEDLKMKGFAGCITKPIDKEKLEFLIRKHIKLL